MLSKHLKSWVVGDRVLMSERAGLATKTLSHEAAQRKTLWSLVSWWLSGEILHNTPHCQIALIPRASTSRLRSVFRSRLRTNSVIALAGLALIGGLFCLTCSASPQSHLCCTSRRARLSEAVPSVRPAKQPAFAGHGCCTQQLESSSGAPCQKLSNDNKQCCGQRSSTAVPPALLQSFDSGTSPSAQPSQPVAIQTGAQPTGFTRRAPLTNRGSTYLLCCTLLI